MRPGCPFTASSHCAAIISASGLHLSGLSQKKKAQRQQAIFERWWSSTEAFYLFVTCDIHATPWPCARSTQHDVQQAKGVSLTFPAQSRLAQSLFVWCASMILSHCHQMTIYSVMALFFFGVGPLQVGFLFIFIFIFFMYIDYKETSSQIMCGKTCCKF